MSFGQQKHLQSNIKLDKSVNQATHTLFETIDNPESMVKLGEENLKTIIKSVGLYQTKAKNVMALSQKLIDLYQGQVPSTFEALTGLPGVGRKTANVILNVAFDRDIEHVGLFWTCNL